jgi:hypothetical protein
MKTTPSKKLQQLIAEKEITEAIKFCQRQLDNEAGAGYYKYWMQRLKSKPKEQKTTSQKLEKSLETKSLKSIKQEIAAEFSESGYRIDESISIAATEADLIQKKKEIISSIPFKSEIYLPTDKIQLKEQVHGLLQVKMLLKKDNLEESKNRFLKLKKIIKNSGHQRVFVIGNGPSLKKNDLALLENEITIGFNGIFLHETFKPFIHIVEDHLVAEDRCKEILKYDCPVKMYPSYLGYCISPQKNTIFLNHLSRISYPVDTDFSTSAESLTYTGGTVTYTGLQIAASLGFKEIILIGVDATYQVQDVERSTDYSTGVLTSKEDAINHFDPRYFGKGYRWHDPNVHIMMQGYRKARAWGEENGVSIKNATIGGNLEVFPRVDYYSLFNKKTTSPKIAVIDFTHINRLCATGIIKKNLFQGWPASSLIHIYADEKNKLKAYQTIKNDLYPEGGDDRFIWAAFRSLIEFDPDALYMRPTHDRASITILQIVAAYLLEKPTIIHYMDDWLKKLQMTQGKDFWQAYQTIFNTLVQSSSEILSICDKMADFLAIEHKISRNKITSIHNYLLQKNLELSSIETQNEAETLIRYFGGLEPDVGLNTLLRVATQVEQLNEVGDGKTILEIYTNPNAIKIHGEKFTQLKYVRLKVQTECYDTYLKKLASSKLNLICYNFDELSREYVKYSLANKLPELIGANKPFLAIGPGSIGTIGILLDHGYPLTITDSEFNIRDAINLIKDPGQSDTENLNRSLESLRIEFSESKNKYGFHRILRAVSGHENTKKHLSYPVNSLRYLISEQKDRLKEVADLDVLVLIPLLRREITRRVLILVKNHGLTWSVRDYHQMFIKKFASANQLLSECDEVKSLALAALICGLGHERYEEMSAIVRSWVAIEASM